MPATKCQGVRRDELWINTLTLLSILFWWAIDDSRRRSLTWWGTAEVRSNFAERGMMLSKLQRSMPGRPQHLAFKCLPDVSLKYASEGHACWRLSAIRSRGWVHCCSGKFFADHTLFSDNEPLCSPIVGLNRLIVHVRTVLQYQVSVLIPYQFKSWWPCDAIQYVVQKEFHARDWVSVDPECEFLLTLIVLCCQFSFSFWYVECVECRPYIQFSLKATISELCAG